MTRMTDAPPSTFHPLATMLAIEAAGLTLIALLIVLAWIHAVRRTGEDV